MWYLQEYNPIQAGSIDGSHSEPHDAAVKRATESVYRPPKGLKTDPKCTLFVGRLNYDTTETTLENHFKKYGDIINTTLIRNQVTGLSEGYAFITFQSERAAREAYDEANKSTLDDHVILVDYERSRNMKNWIPRRLGGGFGGKKESGQLRFGGRDRPFRPISSSRNTSIPYDQRRSDSWIHPSKERHRYRSRSPRESDSKRRRYRSPSPNRHSSRHSSRHGSEHDSRHERKHSSRDDSRQRNSSRYHSRNDSSDRHNPSSHSRYSSKSDSRYDSRDRHYDQERKRSKYTK